MMMTHPAISSLILHKNFSKSKYIDSINGKGLWSVHKGGSHYIATDFVVQCRPNTVTLYSIT